MAHYICLRSARSLEALQLRNTDTTIVPAHSSTHAYTWIPSVGHSYAPLVAIAVMNCSVSNCVGSMQRCVLVLVEKLIIFAQCKLPLKLGRTHTYAPCSRLKRFLCLCHSGVSLITLQFVLGMIVLSNAKLRKECHKCWQILIY